jgi:hypothetical protein
MKTRATALCFLAFVLLTSVAGFAQQTYKLFVPAGAEPIYGTWVSTDDPPEKWVYYSWGYGEGFKKVADERPFHRFTFFIVEKWTDPKGNTWYKILFQAPTGGQSYGLCRISKDHNTFEIAERSSQFPAESDLTPKTRWYGILRRL